MRIFIANTKAMINFTDVTISGAELYKKKYYFEFIENLYLIRAYPIGKGEGRGISSCGRFEAKQSAIQ
jgi:hypothetical protein